MPIYEYICPHGCTREMLRRFDERDSLPICPVHGEDMEWKPSIPAKRTDGIYSYAPNIGSEQAFERKREALREGQRVIDAKDE